MRVMVPISNESELDSILSAQPDELYGGFMPSYWSDRHAIAFAPNERQNSRASFTTRNGLQKTVNDAHMEGITFYAVVNNRTHISTDSNLLVRMFRELEEIGVDGVILGDIALAMFLREQRVTIPFIASTELSAVSTQAVAFLHDLGFSRVVLPRGMLAMSKTNFIAIPTGIELECFILNWRCLFEDGFCTFAHVGNPETFGCQTIKKAHIYGPEHSICEHVAHKVNRWKNRPVACACGLCAIDDLDKNGVNSLKIIGRACSLQQKLASLKAVKSVLALRSLGIPSAQCAPEIFRNYSGLQCNTESCYCPQYLHSTGTDHQSSLDEEPDAKHKSELITSRTIGQFISSQNKQDVESGDIKQLNLMLRHSTMELAYHSCQLSSINPISPIFKRIYIGSETCHEAQPNIEAVSAFLDGNPGRRVTAVTPAFLSTSEVNAECEWLLDMISLGADEFVVNDLGLLHAVRKMANQNSIRLLFGRLLSRQCRDPLLPRIVNSTNIDDELLSRCGVHVGLYTDALLSHLGVDAIEIDLPVRGTLPKTCKKIVHAYWPISYLTLCSFCLKGGKSTFCDICVDNWMVTDLQSHSLLNYQKGFFIDSHGAKLLQDIDRVVYFSPPGSSILREHHRKTNHHNLYIGFRRQSLHRHATVFGWHEAMFDPNKITAVLGLPFFGDQILMKHTLGIAQRFNFAESIFEVPPCSFGINRIIHPEIHEVNGDVLDTCSEKDAWISEAVILLMRWLRDRGCEQIINLNFFPDVMSVIGQVGENIEVFGFLDNGHGAHCYGPLELLTYCAQTAKGLPIPPDALWLALHNIHPNTLLSRLWGDGNPNHLPRIKHRSKNNGRIALIPSHLSWPTKQWPDEYWIELATKLSTWATPCFVGSREEREHLRALVDRSATAVKYFTACGVKEMSELLGAVDLVISIESGPAHLADELGIPIIVLHGPTRFRLFHETICAYIGRTQSCWGCKKSRCHRNNECMRAIIAPLVAEVGKSMAAGSLSSRNTQKGVSIDYCLDGRRVGARPFTVPNGMNALGDQLLLQLGGELALRMMSIVKEKTHGHKTQPL